MNQGLFHCSSGYNGYSCSTYYVLPGTMNWFGAENMCRRMGGTLFSPKSLEDVYYIMNAIQPYRTGTGATNRSFWLGMMCRCQFANPFGCYQCMWDDGRPASAFAFPPTNPFDPRIGTLWSNMYNRPDHFARSLNGQMCLFMTDHWALYECNFADLQGGAVCQIPYGQGNGIIG
uniref:C-type lectin domain-containing protein n=1 Tax=Globodera pallida TaxID=36090 RepID=A0A183CMI0_GLOPA